MNKIKIGLLGGFGVGNIGDDIQPIAIINALGKDKFDYKIFIKGYPNKYVNLNAELILLKKKKLNLRKIISAAKDIDLLLVGGGGIIQEYGRNPFFLKFLTRGLTFLLINVYLFILFKKKVMILGVGVGNVNSILGRYYVKKIFNKINLITVRDEYSKEKLKKLGVFNKQLFVTADPVFMYPFKPNIKKKKDRLNVIINFREGCSYEFKPNGQERFRKNIFQLTKLINYLTSEMEANIMLVPFDESNFKDLFLAKELLRLSKNKSRITIKESFKDMNELLTFFSNADFSICARQHAVICSIIAGTPTIGISYDPKVENIFKRIYLKDLCISINDLNANELIAKIKLINKKSIRNKYNHGREILKKESLKNLFHINNLIKDIKS
jgi:polysaccharide pyruvyl transferase WcaK-like protein